jgi:NAD(P)-dependent dehydrogenase (short-subunit alcohol dehydrogenase family)
MRLENKVAIVTGAANSIQEELPGIGGATAWVLAKEGAKVVLADVQDDQNQKSAAHINENGYNALSVHLDVTNEEDWDRAIKSTLDEFGRIDILVNCAGGTKSAALEETTGELWDAQMDIYAKGTFIGTKAVIPVMRRLGGGSIINISSIYGIVSAPNGVAYGAAKGAVRTFSKTVAVQFGKDNIRVNSVHPGYVLTPATENMISDKDTREWLVGRTPLGRLATPNDIANGILFLASDESNFVTGSELIIDGGVTAH